MSSVRTETQTKKVYKIPAKIPPNAKPIDAEEEQRDLIIEKTEDVVIEEKPYKMEIVWFNAIGFLLLHLAALYGTYLCIFSAKFLTTLWGVFTAYLAALAVTMGAHRLYTHRTFKANKYVRLILVVIQTMAGQNCLWVWIRDHRQHHKYSDTNGDPHNSSRGFFFCHIGWLMVRKHPDVIRKGKTIDMSDINQDPMVMFQKNHYKKLFVIFAIGVPTAIPCLLWNETLWNSFFISFVARLIYSLNFTWLVNSAAHIFGTRPFTKDMSPAENSFVSFFGLGEGWHNYHHTFPWDYRAAEFGQHFNITTSVIDYCTKKGWVYDVKCASQELVKRQAVKKGDGTHPVYGQMNPNDIPVSENY
ncbi:acyl-CoA Delta-9 desaturase-like [Planococcus citri]|uniref:acyl-CoA Delta-9 desaturase-like n=1 Tax=Planococcus citri TaxID=170843 RepID=UPI0031F845C8